jgi:hypothetical protein
MRECVCRCVQESAGERECVCVCVGVYERECVYVCARECKRVQERERESVCVRVCESEPVVGGSECRARLTQMRQDTCKLRNTAHQPDEQLHTTTWAHVCVDRQRQTDPGTGEERRKQHTKHRGFQQMKRDRGTTHVLPTLQHWTGDLGHRADLNQPRNSLANDHEKMTCL